jgi:hypothetical protein
MGKKPFFIESKYPAFEFTICEKCGILVKDVQDGACFWNPNPRAKDKNICRNCYDVWRFERERKAELWRHKHRAMVAYQEIVEEEEVGPVVADQKREHNEKLDI